MKKSKLHPLKMSLRVQTFTPFFDGTELSRSHASQLGIPLKPSGEPCRGTCLALPVLAMALMTPSYSSLLLAMAISEGIANAIDDLDTFVNSFAAALPDLDRAVDFRELHHNVLGLTQPWQTAFANFNKRCVTDPEDYVFESEDSEGSRLVCITEPLALKYFKWAGGHRGSAIVNLISTIFYSPVVAGSPVGESLIKVVISTPKRTTK